MFSLIGTESNWDRYYSTLKRMPRKLKKTAQFVTDALPYLKLRKIERVLDLGCGAGRHSVLLAKNGFDVIGIDFSKSALRMARDWLRKERLESVALIRGTMTNLPFADCSLSAAISVSVIHHALKKDIVTTVGETYRTLGKNGVFLANLASTKDPRYGTGKRIEANTFRILEAFEAKRFGELHHFFARSEVFRLLAQFSRKQVDMIEERPNYWKVMATK